MIKTRKEAVSNALIFTLPGVFAFVAVVIIPFFYGLYLTFTDWDGVRSVKNIVGFANYVTAFQDIEFWKSMLLTGKYVLCTVICVNLIGFGLAWLLTQNHRGQGALRVAFFTPNLLGGVVLGYIWQFIFAKLFVNVGSLTGLEIFKSSWLSTPEKAFWALVIVTSWQYSGYMMMIYIAGLTSVPNDVLEAARIDGASPRKLLIRIVLPLIVPSIVICMFLTVQRAFMVYDMNLSLTGGGPYNSTRLIAMYVYDQAFINRNYGVAQAQALVLFAVVSIICSLQVYLGKKKEVRA